MGFFSVILEEILARVGDECLSHIVPDYRVDDDLATGEVPADMEDYVRLAAEDCPVEIIHVKGR